MSYIAILTDKRRFSSELERESVKEQVDFLSTFWVKLSIYQVLVRTTYPLSCHWFGLQRASVSQKRQI